MLPTANDTSKTANITSSDEFDSNLVCCLVIYTQPKCFNLSWPMGRDWNLRFLPSKTPQLVSVKNKKFVPDRDSKTSEFGLIRPLD